MLSFEPLYFGDRIRVVNPVGDVGVVTLWSPVDTAARKLGEVAPELMDPARSRIAAMATLYGDGMLAMLCNLARNPQINHIVAMGQDLGLDTVAELDAFLAQGVEDAEVLGRPVKRVIGTSRFFVPPDNLDFDALRARLSLTALGKLSAPDFAQRVHAAFNVLPPPRADWEEHHRTVAKLPQRGDDFAWKPSEPRSHQITRARPLDAWEETICRVMQFGRPVTLRKGARIELQNVKVVVTDPIVEPDVHLEAFGFNPDGFRRSQKKMLSKDKPEDQAYSYGARMRSYFGFDGLAEIVEILKNDPESRHAYLSLWDTHKDSAANRVGSVPCQVSAFFRIFDGALTLTASYRTHNLLRAWLENVYGLMAVRDFVAERIGVPGGAITVISHSLTIDPNETRFAVAEAVLESRRKDDDYDRDARKYSLREDPNGYFVVTTDDEAGLIIAQHKVANLLIKRYEGRSAREVEDDIAADMTVSLIRHALWLGRQLGLAEAHLASRKRGARARGGAGRAETRADPGAETGAETGAAAARAAE